MKYFYNYGGDNMRLWHQSLIKYLPNKQLLGQHRELCALRGLGFGRKHRIVDYVFEHPYYFLYQFHLIVMSEMKKRNFLVNYLWYDCHYRGKRLGFDNSIFTKKCDYNEVIYTEHNLYYLKECLINLNSKDIYLKISRKCSLFQTLYLNNLLDYVEIID